MIHYHAQIDANGWVRGVMLREGPRPPQDDALVPLTPDEHQHARLFLPGLRHGADGLELPQDDREAWKAARQHHDGPSAAGALVKIRQARHVFTRDVSVPVPHPPPLQDANAPLAADFPVPGLTLEPMTSQHLDDAASIASSSGIYGATCPPACGQCQPPEAHAWLQLAGRLDHEDQWQLVLSFQGRPLQYEVVTLDPTRTRATFAITYHATRERPSWFWRECEQPVFGALDALGIEALESRTRADRPDWIQSLKDNYGARQVGRSAAGITRLRFPIEMARFVGWPARIALGHDVTTGNVRTWEATAADLPALKQLIMDTVPSTRRGLALQMVDEWWHLDRATFLLGAKDGTLRYARALRLRKPGIAGLAHLGAMYDEPEQAQVTAHVRQWCRAAGYTTLSSFIPTRLMASGNMQAQLQRASSRIKAQRPDWREPFTEVETDV